jgi:type II secretory pathway pseudopilin PulG
MPPFIFEIIVAIILIGGLFSVGYTELMKYINKRRQEQEEDTQA